MIEEGNGQPFISTTQSAYGLVELSGSEPESSDADMKELFVEDVANVKKDFKQKARLTGRAL